MKQHPHLYQYDLRLIYSGYFLQFLHSVTLYKKKPPAREWLLSPHVKRQTSKWVCRLRVFSRPFLFDQEAQAFIPDHKAISLRGENILHATVNQRGGRIMYLCWHP